jgi:hypothetical protein
MLLNSDLGIPGWLAPPENAAGTRGYATCCIPASLSAPCGPGGKAGSPTASQSLQSIIEYYKKQSGLFLLRRWV